MTTIQMITNDQTLIAVQSPKVAAGDVNSTILHIDFDATWNAFEIKSAVFHTAKNSTVHEVLLTDNECIIPASVLAEDGILFVGVRGMTADSEAVKTSTLVKYKIVEGATASQKTIYPELDMYQQYLAALKNEADPVLNAIRTGVEACKAELKAEFDSFKAELKAEFDSLKSSYVKCCDFTETIHTLTSNGETWTATQDCWASLYVLCVMSDYAELYVDGILAVRVEPWTETSMAEVSNTMPPVYVKEGAVIKLVTDASAEIKIFACAE